VGSGRGLLRLSHAGGVSRHRARCKPTMTLRRAGKVGGQRAAARVARATTGGWQVDLRAVRAGGQQADARHVGGQRKEGHAVGMGDRSEELATAAGGSGQAYSHAA
jgi:hypothetical protein